jgi:hypothetical protein
VRAFKPYDEAASIYFGGFYFLLAYLYVFLYEI